MNIAPVADELGILIWQDFLFACSMYPVDEPYLASVRLEVEQQVRRLQHHASVALWAGNNENEAALNDNWYGTQSNFSAYKAQYIQLYVDTMRPIVLLEDVTRSYVVSSPSNGIKSEEDGYISSEPYSPLYGDIHYYNYLSDGWDANIYPRTRFASEFGFQSWSSMRNLRSVAAPGDFDLGLASDMMRLRQHHPGGNIEMPQQVERRLLPSGQHNWNTEEAFERLVSLTQIYQAMATKTEAECHRRWRGMLDENSGEGYTMGSLYWQLNDIWQAPTWAGIEHDGTWKPLHYYAAKFYADILVSPYVTPGGALSVHVANDRLTDLAVDLEMRVFSWAKLDQPLLINTLPIAVPRENAAEVYSVPLEGFLTSAGCGNAIEHASKAGRASEACLIVFRLIDAGQPIAPDNFYLPTPLGDTVGLAKATLTTGSFVLSSGVWPARYVTAVDFTVSSDTVAPFVWLEAGDIKGRFSDNGFVMVESNRTVTFLSLQPVTPAELQQNLTVTSLLDHWP